MSDLYIDHVKFVEFIRYADKHIFLCEGDMHQNYDYDEELLLSTLLLKMQIMIEKYKRVIIR